MRLWGLGSRGLRLRVCRASNSDFRLALAPGFKLEAFRAAGTFGLQRRGETGSPCGLPLQVLWDKGLYATIGENAFPNCCVLLGLYDWDWRGEGAQAKVMSSTFSPVLHGQGDNRYPA